MITIASLWIAALVLLLCFLARSVRTTHRAFRCPIRGTDVRVTVLEAAPEGRPIEVTACSAFMPPTAIECGRPCLELLGRRRSADCRWLTDVPAADREARRNEGAAVGTASRLA